MNPAFYVLRDDALEEPSNYYAGFAFNQTIEETRAHFDRTVGAQKQITKLETAGYDCTKVVIVPVIVKAGKAIKPKLRSQKIGFVLEVTLAKDPEAKEGYYGYKDSVSYWKGNKKKLITHFDIRRRVVQTITASIFKTKAEAQTKLKEWLEAFEERKVYVAQQEAERRENWQYSLDCRQGFKYYPNDWEIKELARTTIQVVEV